MANWWDNLPAAAADAQSITVKLPKARKATAKQNADEPMFPTTPYLDHLGNLVGGALTHTIPDAVGFFGDIAAELARHARKHLAPSQSFSGEPEPNVMDITVPGTGPVSRKANELHDRLIGKDEEPQSEAEKYLYAGVRGAGDAPGGIAAVLAGAGGGLGAQAASDLFPDSDWAPIIGGLAGGIAGGVTPHAIRRSRGARMVQRGSQHPDYLAVNGVIVNTLEGGGTLEHPNVSKKGAIGPQQVMPETARKPGFGIRPWNGKTQSDLARVGRQYSAALMSHYDGDVAKTFAAYNAGPGKIDGLIKQHGSDWWKHVPPETKAYLAKGLNAFDDHQAKNRTVPPIDPRNIAKAARDPAAAGDVQLEDLVPVGPDRLGPIDLVRNEQPSVEEQGLVNRALTPEDNLSEDISFRKDNSNNVVPLRRDIRTAYDESIRKNKEKYPNSTDEDYVDFETFYKETIEREKNKREGNIPKLGGILGKQISDIQNHLTSSKRQEMDASVPRVPMDSSHEKFTRYPEENVPANDPTEPKKTLLQRAKEFWEDESGSYRGGYDKEEPNSYEGLDPEDKLRKALKEAKPVSAEARKMYAEERSARAGKLAELQARGAGLPEQLRALKGQMPRPDRSSILEHFTPEDVKTLQDRINFSNHLFPYEKMNALDALNKLLGAEGVKIPTAGEIKLLSGVLSDDTIKAMLENRPALERFWHHVGSGINLPRSLLASFDLSAPLRQGVVFVGRKEFWKAFAGMFKQFGSEKAFKAVQDEIRSRPTYLLMRKANLALTDTGHYLGTREEAFMSDWAEKIPVVGAGVHASNRAYIGFLNKLRADVFDDMIRKGKDLGIDYHNNPRALKAVSDFVNAATGRGSLGKLNQAAPALSSVFFSPRLIAGRIQMLNPMMYARALPLIEKNPGVRLASREAAKSMLTFGAIAMTIVGLAKMGGAEVSANPTSSDFGKIKVGNTRYDLWGGFQQYVRLSAQLVSGKATSSTGEVKDLNNPKYGGDTRRDVLIKFIENKLSPMFSLGDDVLRGRDAVGQPVTVKSEIKSKMIPLVAQDIADLMRDQGYVRGAAMGAPSIFGVGVQTYQPKTPKPKKRQGVDEFGFPTDKLKIDDFGFPKPKKKRGVDEFGFPQ